MRNSVLGLSLISLLSITCIAQELPGIQVESLAKSSTTWDGSALPSFPTTQPEITVLKFLIEPGAKLPMHKHPVINAAYMIKGELTVKTEKGQTHHIEAGDALVELVDQWHFGHNQGTVPAELVVFYAGTNGQKITELREQQ